MGGELHHETPSHLLSPCCLLTDRGHGRVLTRGRSIRPLCQRLSVPATEVPLGQLRPGLHRLLEDACILRAHYHWDPVLMDHHVHETDLGRPTALGLALARRRLGRSHLLTNAFDCVRQLMVDRGHQELIRELQPREVDESMR